MSPYAQGASGTLGISTLAHSPNRNGFPGAQKARIRAARVLIGLAPTSAQNGRYPLRREPQPR